jgi:hypothetical protein
MPISVLARRSAQTTNNAPKAQATRNAQLQSPA